MPKTIPTAERDLALNELRKFLKPKQTVYTILRHVSSSGMQRRISLVVPWQSMHFENVGGLPTEIKQPNIISLDWLCDRAGLAARSLNKGEGLIVNGCGMDMGFHLVYGLGQLLWPNGTPEPHGFRNGEPDSDGGYALKHSWL